tara:strand:+ start:591 stop:1247 length:657 start_codon:yes stop_codon:yes gene_type:complete
MPDFSEILKIAVEQQDWKLICGLYTNITGEPLSIPNAVVEEDKKEEDDVLSKEYSIEELKYQNQLAPQEQEEELLDKDIDNIISSRYNDFTAPPRNTDTESGDFSGRKMRSEPVGSKTLKNVVGVSEEGFVDDLTESLTDPETGEKLTGNNNNAKITPRNRRKQLGMNDTSLIDATCSSCNKTIKVSSSIAFGYSASQAENTWQCNDCSVRKGRRGRG